jgi:hypothetical protein
VSKELKAGKTHVKDELSDDKKRKIKIFVKDYMDKIIARRAQKASQRSDNVPGPSDSVSTTTPQLPGSTPREGTAREVDVDTPASSSERSPADEGDVASLSKEFLGTLEKEGLLDM